MTIDAFSSNELVADAVIRNIAVIGEAARHIPDEVVERFPDLPWTEMRGMRNILVHEYFGADLKTIWDTVQYDLPPLLPRLRQILAEEERRGGRPA